MTPKKQSAPNIRGAKVTKLAGGVNSKNKIFRCGVQHTSKLRRELQAKGLALGDTVGLSQRQTLLRVLKYLGSRGINTPEAVGVGFYRVATRIQELEAEGWRIASLRECLVGADGLEHRGVARYVLLKGRARHSPQLALDLEPAC